MIMPFTLADGRTFLYQWDTGRKIIYSGDCAQFHFANKVYGRTVDVDAAKEGETSTALIPDFFLQSAVPLTIYIFRGTDLDGYTKEEITLDVAKRNKPADYVFTPSEQATLDQAAKIRDEAKRAADSADLSAKNAKQSEISAKKSEENAATSEINASTSESNAATSKDNADKYAEDAKTSKDEAAQALADLLALLGSDIPVAGADGKIPISYIPATAIHDTLEITSEDQLTGLTAQRGDIAELIEDVDGVKTITKSWQLLGTADPSIISNWVVWGTSYAVKAGNATAAENANNASMINGHRWVNMTKEQFDIAVKDAETIYTVYDPSAEV